MTRSPEPASPASGGLSAANIPDASYVAGIKLRVSQKSADWDSIPANLDRRVNPERLDGALDSPSQPQSHDRHHPERIGRAAAERK
jgi:hypothetical protein